MVEIPSDFKYQKTLKRLGISYLGTHNQSMKMKLSEKAGTLTYCIYLAPHTSSGYQVCPFSKYCKDFCLSKSGHAMIEEFAGYNKLLMGRIKRTRLFFEDRETFMLLLIHEIERFKKQAERRNMEFSVRLNGTSDLNPESFVYKGKNILEIFPDVQFYDYTKCPNRIQVAMKYPNYDLTFSFDGHNFNDCEKFLKVGGKASVVFYDKKMPKKFNGYNVVDGNETDIRYKDTKQAIIGLHYHKTANDYKVINNKRTYVKPNTPFVIMPDDDRIEW